MTTPELDERRIDAMRSTIMHSVDADVSKRGRRARRSLGVLAAACFVVVVGGVGFSSLTGTGDGSNDSAGSGFAGSEAASDSAGKSGPSKVAPRDVREVVTTGNVDVTVADPRDVAQRFAAWVESHQGRVDGRIESKNDDGRASARLAVRVPGGQMSAALSKLATYGDVGTVDVQNDDVTAQGQDLDARITALNLSIDRLERILSQADSSAEVVSAEGALTQRQEQVESLQAQRKALSEQVALSTLNVELIQKGDSSSVAPGGFTGGLTTGWNALIDTVNGVVSVAGVLVPWLALLMAGWGIWRVARRVRSAS